MVWVVIVVSVIFFAVGVAVTLDPARWAASVRAGQRRYLGPWAPPDDEIDRQHRRSDRLMYLMRHRQTQRTPRGACTSASAKPA